MDDDLRLLQRQATAGDREAELRFARAAARSGQTSELAGRIAAATSETSFEVRRRVVSSLWAEHVRQLAPDVCVPGERAVVKLAADPEGAFVAWTELGVGPSQTVGCGPFVGDGRRQREPVALEQSVTDLRTANGRIFCQVARGAALMELAFIDGAIRERASGRVDASVRSLSPDGGLYAFELWEHAGIAEWPSRRNVVERRANMTCRVSVAWPSRELAIGSSAGVREQLLVVEVLSFEDELLNRVEKAWRPDRLERFEAVGGGSVLTYDAELILYKPLSTHLLVDANGPIVPSLAADAKTIRALVAGRAHRFSLDEPPSTPLQAPEHRLALRALWHPSGDLAFTLRAGRYELLAPDHNEPLFALEPGLIPVQWIEGGRGLVVLRDARRPGPEVTIEIWR